MLLLQIQKLESLIYFDVKIVSKHFSGHKSMYLLLDQRGDCVYILNAVFICEVDLSGQ